MTRCIGCESTTVEAFLDLGATALANKFLLPQDVNAGERSYPLVVGFCHTCAHVQLMQPVPPVEMFDDYLYISSLSTTLVTHLASLASTIVRRFVTRGDELVIDIGSNDGTLLSSFAAHGVRTLGVDPARNLAPLARAKGIDVVVDYFNAQTATTIVTAHGLADIVTATNVFLHIPELRGFMTGLDRVLAPGGRFVVEAHYLGDLLDQCAFDTIYHEHCSYWSLNSVSRMFARFGFEVFDVERLPIHHGQMRMFVARRGTYPVTAAVQALLDAEGRDGLTSFGTFVRFAARVAALREKLQTALHGWRAEGRRIVGYGAPAKGNTLISYLGLGPEDLAYICDKSALKQGRVTPGSHIPVVSPGRLVAEQPDYVLLLAWNFVEEILAEQSAYRASGGKFVIPVPEVAIF
jgi:SAM-dependent methyltransferase